MLSVSKPTSLIQQKKQQWAREREEMSHLYLPWGTGEKYSNRLQARNQFASNLELHKHASYEYQEPGQRLRSPSLPPIHNFETGKPKEESSAPVLNRNIPSAKRFTFYDEDCEGDTSGYGSETVNHMNRNLIEVSDANRNPVIAWQQENNDNSTSDKVTSNTKPAMAEGPWSARSPRTAEEGRPRWGDRGVATGKLWEPTAATARLPQMPNQKRGTPSWVERGLNMIKNTSEVLVIDQRSSSNSTGLDCDRYSCNGSDEGRTFLRGQNVPLEPEIKAQRENKRLKALELQSIILNQLEDREKRRQEERDQQLREEKLEELRVQRQREEDRQRLEAEKERHQEKQLLEQKKLETLKKALEEAERKAKLEKERRFISLKKSLQSDVIADPQETTEYNIIQETNHSQTEPTSPIKSNTTYDAQSAKSKKNDCSSYQTSNFNSPRSSIHGNLNLFIHSVPPLALVDNKFNIVPIGINDNGEILGQSNGLQLAVLLPQSLANNIYSVSLNTVNESTNTNKILTPNKYRSVKMKDASTQTDESVIRNVTDKIVETEEFERNFDKEYSNIDENAPLDSHHSTLKKDRKYRSEERYKKELETRPKWGVNRPAAQYKKQSEKDPFYSQKRKIRQKHRSQARQYLSQSSDDSRSPSPPTRSEKTTENISKYRNSLSQSYWRNKRLTQDLSKNTNISEPVSNVQIEFNYSGQIPIVENNENKNSPKLSPTKRITLSQKFINDKYGNRKLWTDDDSERNSKPNGFDVENRKKIIDQINTAKREYLEKNENQENLTKNKMLI